MTKDQKNEVIELLKGKFSQYNNFYITDTESLSVDSVNTLRGQCFDKQVEMRVAKNTLIRKALESLDNEKYSGVYESLHKVTALLFSENPKEPAMILTSFRKQLNGDKPFLKAAFINGDVYLGDDQLTVLTKIKSKNELIGEVIGLLQSPAKRVIAALLHNAEKKSQPVEDVAAVPAPESPLPAAIAAVAPVVAESPLPSAAPVVAESPVPAAIVAPVVAESPLPESTIASNPVESPVPSATVAPDVADSPSPAANAASEVAEAPLPMATAETPDVPESPTASNNSAPE